MDKRIEQLQKLVKNASSLHINRELLDYSGMVEYYTIFKNKRYKYGKIISF